MLVKTISTTSAVDESATSDDGGRVRSLVMTLSYGQTAAALSASDMPTKRVPLSVEQITDYAVQGVMRLGIEGVEDLAEESRRLGRRANEVEGHLESMERSWPDAFETREIARVLRDLNARQSRLWGGGRRMNRAHGAAYHWVRSVRPL